MVTQFPSSVAGGGHTLKALDKLVYGKVFEKLVDFDSHLDTIELDWTNPEINRAVADMETVAARE